MSENPDINNSKSDADAADDEASKPKSKRRWGWAIIRMGGLAVTGFVVVLVLLALFALSGRSVELPGWVVGNLEERLAHQLPVGEVTIDAVTVGLRDGAYRPTLDLLGVSVSDANGVQLLELPQLRTKFDTSELLQGRIALETLALEGTEIRLNRDETGAIAFELGGEVTDAIPASGTLADAIKQIDLIFADDMFRELEEIRADNVALSLGRQDSDEVLRVENGQLALTNHPEKLELEVTFGVKIAGDNSTADLVFKADKAKGSPGMRLVARFEDLNTRVLGAQVAALTMLEILDAPASGLLTADIGEDGHIASMFGSIDIAEGVLRPAEQAKPLPFNFLRTAMRFDRATERLYLDSFKLDAPELRMNATGHTDLLDREGGFPRTILGQIRLEDVLLDPEGVFENPVSFETGALDWRYVPDALRFDVGQLVLSESGSNIIANGVVRVGDDGWQAAMDAGIAEIPQDRLLALWPVSAKDRLREWLTTNIKAGSLKNAAAAIRVEPDQKTLGSVTFDFEDASVAFLKTLPEIDNGRGYLSILKDRMVMQLYDGQVETDVSGRLNVGGSTLIIEDMTKDPTIGEIDLQLSGPLPAALWLLDEEPFEFLKKGGLPKNIADGDVSADLKISLPFERDVDIDDVNFSVDARLLAVSSDQIVEDRELLSSEMRLQADNNALQIGGPGTLDGVPIDAVWSRRLDQGEKGSAKISGTLELSPRSLKTFGINLPPGSVTGSGRANIEITLAKDRAPTAVVFSDLNGVGLSVEALDWAKSRNGKAEFRANLTLGETPSVDALSLEAPGLSTKGSVELLPGGGLKRARLNPLRVLNRLNSRVDVIGQGQGQQVKLAIRGGTIDIRKFGIGSGKRSPGGPPLDLNLDQVVVMDGVVLNNFRGSFRNRRGLDGTFEARLNGKANVRGTVVPTERGPAFRITSNNGGAVLRASGLFKTANGGEMSLVLQPTGEPGAFNGTLKIEKTRVKKAPALADLLSAVSVVGLLEQLSGDGILFNNVTANFQLTPGGVRLTSSSAVGPSMGISMEGVYQTASERLDMQGVVSPIYAVNGLFGALFAPRRGEGLFGFNYKLRGAVEDPKVSVNPLSVFTPGIFREIFRQPPPKLKR